MVVILGHQPPFISLHQRHTEVIIKRLVGSIVRVELAQIHKDLLLL